MPELPEVEIVKQSLYKNIKSKKIKKTIVRNRNLRFKIHKDFEKLLKNKRILDISRFSKFILINLEKDFHCIFHLGMSGTVHIVKKKTNSSFTNSSFYHSPFLPKKHNHVEFFFDNFKIVYNDPRRFGFFKVFFNQKDLTKYFNKYGPEPFDKKFNIKYLRDKLTGKSKNIKNYLIDQSFISGIGNIYANEILFFCKINPFRKSSKLLLADCKKLIFYSKYVLKNAIKKGGSTIKNFINTDGNSGFFQKHFKVYQRENLKCPNKNCSGIIRKKNISNRSTFYCNICQKY